MQGLKVWERRTMQLSVFSNTIQEAKVECNTDTMHQAYGKQYQWMQNIQESITSVMPLKGTCIRQVMAASKPCHAMPPGGSQLLEGGMQWALKGGGGGCNGLRKGSHAAGP